MDDCVDIIIPVYNESANITKLVQEIKSLNLPLCSILFVDDGSTDNTLNEIKKIMEEMDFSASTPPHPTATTFLKDKLTIKFISFSKNFGHQVALKAGFDYSTGACAITMDGDLQHPPALIPQMLTLWKNGYDIVQMKRKGEENAGFLKSITSNMFYKVFNKISDTRIEPGTADFRLMDKKVVEFCRNTHEQELFWRGLIPWSGFKTAICEFIAPARNSGSSKYSFKKMLNLAKSGFFGFSLLPLKLAMIFGCALLCFNFVYGLRILWQWFGDGNVTGWTSLMFVLLIMMSMQFIFIGIIGAYVGKIFIAGKGRPTYIIKEKSGSGNEY